MIYSMKTLLIGTGYLGRAVVERLINESVPVIHTYNSRQTFPDSIQFDLFSEPLEDSVQLDTIDTVVFTSNIEKESDTQAIEQAMRRILAACVDKRVIYTSSDAVFDGKRGKYVETDETNPVTAYGRHKLLCEQLVAELSPNSCIIRPSYIYGYSMGKLDRRLREAVELAQAGQPIKRFVDMYKTPTEVNFLAESILQAARSDVQGILHVGGTRLSVYEFTKQALAALGEDASLVAEDHIPEDTPPEVLVDTSMDSSRLKETLGLTHPSIAACLTS